MSTAPHRPCKNAGCSGFAEPGSRHCAKHQPAAQAQIAAGRACLDAQRGSSHSRGYDSEWNRVSKLMRQTYPLSSGYLTRTVFWTHNLAQQFSTLRQQAASAGQYAEFFAHLPPPSPSLSLSPSTFRASGTRFLEEFPIYLYHASPRIEPSEVTDHIIPHRGDATLMWAEWNLQPISKRQHDEKTATEDGGFGHSSRRSVSVFQPSTFNFQPQ